MSTSTKLRVDDVILPLASFAVVKPKTMLKEAMEQMTKRRLGIACVVDDDGKLVGVFTDGDIRRMLLKDQKPFSALFADDIVVHANRNPTKLVLSAPLSDALRLMEDKNIWDVPVVDGGGKLAGLLHLHPVIKAVLNQP
jgi:arabinose-5-phosphate isomerase